MFKLLLLYGSMNSRAARTCNLQDCKRIQNFCCSEQLVLAQALETLPRDASFNSACRRVVMNGESGFRTVQGWSSGVEHAAEDSIRRRRGEATARSMTP